MELRVPLVSFQENDNSSNHCFTLAKDKYFPSVEPVRSMVGHFVIKSEQYPVDSSAIVRNVFAEFMSF